MTSLKEALADKLTSEQLAHLRTSFDIIGDICIIEVPRVLEKKELIIAKTLLSLNPQFRVVAKKKGGHVGRYRTQQLKVLAGSGPLITKHKEWGLVYSLDVGTCYFSPRLGTERMRISQQIKKGERVLVMFSGVGPYVLHLAKHSSAGQIIGIELNPSCHKYAQENAVANKLQDKVLCIKGNANKTRHLTKGKFDRIIMPLPKSASRYLKAALCVAKSGAVMHFYTFADEGAFESAGRAFFTACDKHGKKCRVLRIVSTGQNAPRKHRVCVDAVLGRV